jgi:hypothetical protein
LYRIFLQLRATDRQCAHRRENGLILPI